MRATIQSRPLGTGDLAGEAVSTSLLLAVSIDESNTFQATWTGPIALPPEAGTPDGDALGYPGLRRPGGDELTWRSLIEEHELVDADPPAPGRDPVQIPRLVYADTIAL